MFRFFFSLIVVMHFAHVPMAVAQDDFYVQIEAQPSLSVARDRLLDYAAALPDVTGFELGRGWYGIALGPYPRSEADRVLSRLLSERIVPSDSYVKDAARYGQRFWWATPTVNPAAPTTQPGAPSFSNDHVVTSQIDLEAIHLEAIPTGDGLEALENDAGLEMVDGFYVQIEAQPNLSIAQDRLQSYAAALPDVNGFELGNGWYGIALGPYSRREEAAFVLRKFLVRGLIPSDSYIKASDRYGRLIWRAQQHSRSILKLTEPEAGFTPGSGVQVADETLREAQISESQLLHEERVDLQLALRWAGFYDAPIDGTFGASTRLAMAAWQKSRGFDTTGILTSAQRGALFSQYDTLLGGIEISPQRDARAGISIDLPLGAVKFDRYDSPFVYYASTGAVEGAQVILISQPGDPNRLAGLYELMQTLDIVPPDGPRERNRDSFILTGQNSSLVSHTEAWLYGGAIKGFTLIWPAHDEERRTRILGSMRSSFAPIDGVLEPPALIEDDVRTDLVAGISLDKPKTTASGFYVSREGVAVTTDTAVTDCNRITLNNLDEAELVRFDPSLGIAVLRTGSMIQPNAVAHFRDGMPRLNSEIAVAGYSFGGILPSAAMTFGHLSSLRGLNDEDTLFRLAISTFEGDIGGPVVDESGGVIGMLVPLDTGDRLLPDNVGFALNKEAIQKVLSNIGVMPETADGLHQMHPVDLTQKTTAMTVLVSCWK